MGPRPEHLGVGSTNPPKKEGTIRLYSMEYCPFAQRVRLILEAKQIPYEVVNINLLQKPDWYLKDVHPKGLVPGLDIGDKIITESLDICDYLDKTYPPSLYPAEPEKLESDKKIIGLIGAIGGVFAKALYTPNEKTNEEWVKEFLNVLQPVEDEYKKRGTPFFGGDKPSMVDYILWPWAERSKQVGILMGQELPFADNDLSELKKWRKLMKEQPAVQAVFNNVEKHVKYFELKKTGNYSELNSIASLS